jgi:serine/threonine protein kinase
VKVFNVPFGGTPEARAAFAAEWTRLKTITHPAIARCYGGGFEEKDAYLAYELIEGDTLQGELSRRNRLSWESVLDMAEPIVEALQYLHAQDLVHGALFPDKVIFAGLSPVLVDIRVDRHDTPYRTGRPPSPAEVALLAPELLTNPSAYSPHSDLYMLGSLMYLAVTGRPPAIGDSIEQISNRVQNELPESPASIVLDCPVWLDKLIMHLLQKAPAARPHGTAAVKLALAEVRKRSMSRTGVAEHASSGFSPLNVTSQDDRDVARKLLGREALSFDQPVKESVAWHDRPAVLIGGLVLIAAIFAYVLWPLSEDSMRQRAEALINEGTKTSMMHAKNSYLVPMVDRFPDGKHADWAAEQIDQVEMLQAESALEKKIKRNLPLKDEGERLFAEANQFERFGDSATALDRYRSMVTLLGDQPQYKPFVNLALRQIGKIESAGSSDDEASRIIQAKLDQAASLQAQGKVIAARKIWYSVVELYGNNDKVGPLVAQAQDNLAQERSSTNRSSPPSERADEDD